MLARLVPSSSTRLFRLTMSSTASRRIQQLAAHMSSTSTTKEAVNGGEESVLFREQFAAGIYTLNRPKARNALTLDMIHTLRSQIRKWNDSRLVKLVIGTGKDGFCAGGDVKAIAEAIKSPDRQREAIDFFRDEFMLDYELSQLSKPYLVIMDGITMGGGVGLCIPAPFRVATERTLFAMPEAAIGYFTDVGATHFLSHLDGQLGTYLGLTSHQLRGREVFELGIATHFVPSRNIPLLLDRLSRLEGAEVSNSEYYSVINEAIDEFYEARTDADPPQRLMGDVREAIDHVFAPKNVSEIMNRLNEFAKGVGGELGKNALVQAWATETENTIRQLSPTSVCVTREAIRLAREMDCKSAWEMEMRLAYAYCTTMAGDFVEGVQAKLFEKRLPKWKPEKLSEVDTESVEMLLSSNEALPEGFVLEPGVRSSQGRASFGLPNEEFVKDVLERLRMRNEKRNGALNERALLDEMEIELRGKHGVRDRVLEILRRKTKEGLVWKEL